MRVTILLIGFTALFVCAAGPATQPTQSIAGIDRAYRDATAAAKRDLDDEIAKANRAYATETTKAKEQRIASLQLLLAQSVKSGDAVQAVACRKEIDQINVTVAKRVIYVCQASGSMLSVFGAVKQKLKESVNSLSSADGQQFNILFFSSGQFTSLFNDKMQDATKENIKAATNFVDRQTSGGGSDPIAAIKFALQQKPDIVYFLSDGLPNISKFDEVEKAFTQGNPGGKIAIKCIYVESTSDPKLEARLKQITNGTHDGFAKISKSDM